MQTVVLKRNRKQTLQFFSTSISLEFFLIRNCDFKVMGISPLSIEPTWDLFLSIAESWATVLIGSSGGLTASTGN